MNESLRQEYLTLLAQFGLEPRSIPPEAAAQQAAIVEHLKKQSLASGDESMAKLIEQTYEQDKERYLAETRHPAVVLIEATAEHVEKSIRAIKKYRDLLTADVFVGEFPIGLINAQVVRSESGFLILLNSGLLTAIKQVVEFLILGDPDHARSNEANRQTIEGVVAVLKAYLQFGDPFFGPKPLTGGLKMLLVHAPSRACESFVVAHEYGHVIAGHFNEQATQLEQVQTEVGTLDVVKKEWSQELEADVIGHKVILGVEDYAQIDLNVIDRALASDGSDTSLLACATEVKAAIAAPFIFLTIDAIIEDVQEALRYASGQSREEPSHPPARKRMANLHPHFASLEPRYTGYMNFAAILWAHYDEICERIIKLILPNSVKGTQSSGQSRADG